MARVVYSGPSEAVELSDGKRFVRGEAVEVSTALAQALTARSDFRSAPAEKDGK